jgi:hypothetical protein
MNDQNLLKGEPYRFQPGQSGNPGGRPKRRAISDSYEAITRLELPEADRIRLGLWEGATYQDALAMVTVKAALQGKVDAVREIREAIEGKAGTRHEVAPGFDGEIRVVYEIQPGMANNTSSCTIVSPHPPTSAFWDSCFQSKLYPYFYDSCFENDIITM